MMKHVILRNALATVAAAVVLAAGPAWGASRDGARIVNSGSTNAKGWEIDVRTDRSGSAIAADGTTHRFTLTANATTAFFHDIQGARTSGATTGGCMKSMSFGSRTWVYWHAWQSSDLSCPTVGGARALAADVTAIEDAANIQAVQPSRMIRIPVEPRRADRTPPPSGPKNAHP
jgi:hypothetical protein